MFPPVRAVYIFFRLYQTPQPPGDVMQDVKIRWNFRFRHELMSDTAVIYWRTEAHLIDSELSCRNYSVSSIYDWEPLKLFITVLYLSVSQVFPWHIWNPTHMRWTLSFVYSLSHTPWIPKCHSTPVPRNPCLVVKVPQNHRERNAVALAISICRLKHEVHSQLRFLT